MKHLRLLPSIKNILFIILGYKLLHLLNCNKPLAIPFPIMQCDSLLRLSGHFPTSSIKVLVCNFFFYMQYRSEYLITLKNEWKVISFILN